MAKTRKKTKAVGPQMVWTGVGDNNLLFGMDKNSVVYTWNFQLGGWVFCKETEEQANTRLAQQNYFMREALAKRDAKADEAGKGALPLAETETLVKVAAQTTRTPVAQDNSQAALPKAAVNPLG